MVRSLHARRVTWVGALLPLVLPIGLMTRAGTDDKTVPLAPRTSPPEQLRQRDLLDEQAQRLPDESKPALHRVLVRTGESGPGACRRPPPSDCGMWTSNLHLTAMRHIDPDTTFPPPRVAVQQPR